MAKKVLVIDDQRVTVIVLEEVLKNNGYEVITSTDSSLAAQLIEKNSPDIVILDILMPDIDGIELLKIIRENYSELPVITISSDKLYLRISEKLGASASFTKPIFHDDLIAMVNKLS
ncbi:MAG: response regulator [Gammaproteobacteria bacterium]|nr:response regulator [Gammaproteobacteria bacterium]MDH5592696.1 response regulator [Gammaproteobacteria bacterium]